MEQLSTTKLPGGERRVVVQSTVQTLSVEIPSSLVRPGEEEEGESLDVNESVFTPSYPMGYEEEC